MRFRSSLVVIVASWLPAAPAAAGVILHVVQSRDSAMASAHRQLHTETDVSAQGDGLRADVTASDDPSSPVGDYMLFPNDQTIYVVDPAKHTYITVDRAAMAGMMQQMQRMQQQQLAAIGSPYASSMPTNPLQPEHVVIEKKLDEAGPVMLGFPTQHVVYDVSYHMPPFAPGAPAFDYHEKYELWATKALDERLAAAPALKRAGLAKLGGRGGSLAGPAVTDAIASHGFILKQNFTQESQQVGSWGGVAMGPAALLAHHGQPRNTSSFVVTAIRDESLQADRFEVPKGYTETEMGNANMGTMPDISKLPGQPGASSPPGNNPQQMPDLNNIPK